MDFSVEVLFSLIYIFERIILSGIAGITIGSIYAFGTSHPSPIGVSVSTAINLGLVSAQYAGIFQYMIGFYFLNLSGFRFILPSGIERGVTSHLMSQEERDLVKYGVSPWEILDIKLPPMFSDLNERDKKVLGSVAAGALSGYINTSLQGKFINFPKNSDLNLRSL